MDQQFPNILLLQTTRVRVPAPTSDSSQQSPIGGDPAAPVWPLQTMHTYTQCIHIIIKKENRNKKT